MSEIVLEDTMDICEEIQLNESSSNTLMTHFKIIKKDFLVVQWLRIHLPTQGTEVQSVVWEDSTCHGATKPKRHNC